MDKNTKAASGKTTGTIKTEQTSTVPRDEISHRQANIKIIQNILLVWLDNNVDNNNNDYRNAIAQLRHVVNEIITFNDGDDCFQFVEGITDNKVRMIIPASLGEVLVSCVHDVSQVNSIFILCDNKKYRGEWSKVRGVFTNITPICDALKQTVQQCEQNSISMSFIATTGDMSNKNLNQLEPSFMYTQIMKEILLTIEFEEQHFKQFIDYCCEALPNNPSQLQKVNKIQQEYRQETPIWWYTYECLLYPMLNRALRTLDADLMITLGFFIKDLHLQIEQLHQEQFGSSNSKETFVVYRGQGMVKEDFEKMTKTKGGLLSFNCFLSTSKNYNVSFVFAESVAANPDLVGILFVMTIDPSQSTTPFAAIDEVSCYKDQEEEVLFSMHTVFRINDITPMDENQRFFRVDLTLTNDNDPDLRVLTNRIREETYPDHDGWERLGLTLLQMGQSKKSEEVYQILLKQTTTEKERASIYNQIGKTKQTQGDYHEAIIYYKKSLEINKKILPPNDPALAASYNNIGIVYKNMGEYSKALSSHEKALAIRQQSLPPNHPDLASTYNNIGAVYQNMGEYSKARSVYERAVKIAQQSLAANHPHRQIYEDNLDIVKKKM